MKTWRQPGPWLLALALALVGACSDDTGDRSDGGPDAGVSDAAEMRAPMDAGGDGAGRARDDAGDAMDAGASAVDAAAAGMDAAAGDPDAAMGPVDAGDGLDAGAPDAAGTADTGPPDAAADDSDAGSDPACGPRRQLPQLALESVGSFLEPVFVAAPPGDPDSLFVVERGGTIRVVHAGVVRAAPFITITDLTASGGEQGLLGLAFHPDYATNGRFFVYKTVPSPRRNVVAEYRVSGDPYVADPTEVARLVEEPDPNTNHNAGMLAFGPDGYLYVAMGDGGGGNDQHGTIGNGLDRTTLLGSLLRLDVEAAANGYAAVGNPFVAPERPQIWHYGLRNPWRFSFDADTGDLYIGDVGQGAREEVTRIAAGAPGGLNLGWRAYEGSLLADPDVVALVPEHTGPSIEYGHASPDQWPPAGNGCAVIGGYVYRGSAIPDLRGFYLYGDYCRPAVVAATFCNGELDQHLVTDIAVTRMSSFGQDGHGELYTLSLDGQVSRIVPAP